MIKKRWLIAMPIAVILVGFLLSLIAPDWMARLGGAATVVGILTVLLTYSYVVLTGRYVELTGRMVQQMVASQEEERRAREEERRPYMIFDIEFQESIAYLVINNIGQKPAIDFTMKCTPSLVGAVNISEEFLSKRIAFFPPGKTLRGLVGGPGQVTGEGTPDEYKIVLSYTWQGAEDFVSEPYTINLDFYQGLFEAMRKKGIHDVAESLEKIQAGLKKGQQGTKPKEKANKTYEPFHKVLSQRDS